MKDGKPRGPGGERARRAGVRAAEPHRDEPKGALTALFPLLDSPESAEGDGDAAAAAVRSHVLAAEPETIGAMVSRGRLMRRNGSNGLAATLFLAAAERLPGNAAIRLDLATAYERANRLDDAKAAFESALAIDDDSLEARKGLGRLARRSGDSAAALAHFEQALQLGPDDRKLREAVAEMLARHDRLDEAAEQFKTLIAETQGARDADVSRAGYYSAYGSLLARMHRRPEAHEAFRAALAIDPDDVRAHEALGRLARRSGDHETAAEHFRKALTERSGGLKLRELYAESLTRLGRLDEAAEELEALVRLLSEGDQPAGERARAAAALGTVRARLNQAGEAETAFRAALAFDPTHAGAFAALGRLARQRGDSEQALEALQSALAQRPDDANLRGTIAKLLMNSDRLDEAAALLEATLATDPDNVRALVRLARVRNRQGDEETALRLLRQACGSGDDADAQLALARHLRDKGENEEADRALDEALRIDPTSASALGLSGAWARTRGDDEGALSYFERAAAARPDDLLLAFEVAVSLVDLERAEEAERIIGRIDATPGALDNERLRMRRFEFDCDRMRFESAMAGLAALQSNGPLPAKLVSSAAALLASRGEWARVVALFTERVVDFSGSDRVQASPQLMESVARAARALRRQQETIELVERWDLGGAAASAGLRDQLAEELVLLRALRGETSPPEAAPQSPLRSERAARLGRLLAHRAAQPAATIFLCSDLAYLPGAMTALSSALRNNRAELRACAFKMFLSDDAAPVAAPMIARLASAYGVAIDSLRASELGRDHTGFRVDWGFFSPGHRLSDAAYYRILAGLWLVEQKASARALYLDSDICIGPGVDELLGFDLGGRPLAARLELSTLPSIRRAARKLGLPVEHYFNSGVLLFDLHHPDIKPALERTLEIAVTTPEKLSYVDQCAFNLAFDGKVANLPEPFNYYVRVDSDPTPGSREAPVVHYLSRPKPWDPAYDTPNNSRWRREFEALAGVLTLTQARQLMALCLGVEVGDVVQPEASGASVAIVGDRAPSPGGSKGRAGAGRKSGVRSTSPTR